MQFSDHTHEAGVWVWHECLYCFPEGRWKVDVVYMDGINEQRGNLPILEPSDTAAAADSGHEELELRIGFCEEYKPVNIRRNRLWSTMHVGIAYDSISASPYGTEPLTGSFGCTADVLSFQIRAEHEYLVRGKCVYLV